MSACIFFCVTSCCIICARCHVIKQLYLSAIQPTWTISFLYVRMNGGREEVAARTATILGFQRFQMLIGRWQSQNVLSVISRRTKDRGSWTFYVPWNSFYQKLYEFKRESKAAHWRAYNAAGTVLEIMKVGYNSCEIGRMLLTCQVRAVPFMSLKLFPTTLLLYRLWTICR